MKKSDKEAVINMLKEIPNITVVCRLLGIDRKAVYVEKKRDPEFWDEVVSAKEEGYDLIEEEARRRAVEGVVEPVFYKGEVVGGIRKYSDKLLETLLKGYKPSVFNRGVNVKVGDGERVSLSIDISGDQQ